MRADFSGVTIHFFRSSDKLLLTVEFPLDRNTDVTTTSSQVTSGAAHARKPLFERGPMSEPSSLIFLSLYFRRTTPLRHHLTAELTALRAAPLRSAGPPGRPALPQFDTRLHVLPSDEPGCRCCIPDAPLALRQAYSWVRTAQAMCWCSTEQCWPNPPGAGAHSAALYRCWSAVLTMLCCASRVVLTVRCSQCCAHVVALTVLCSRCCLCDAPNVR